MRKLWDMENSESQMGNEQAETRGTFNKLLRAKSYDMIEGCENTDAQAMLVYKRVSPVCANYWPPGASDGL